MSSIGNELLTNVSLPDIPRPVEVPGYKPGELDIGILHIGPGSFHRAHQCSYFENLARAGDRSCGVFGVSLNSSGARSVLAAQDYLYSLVLMDGEAKPAVRVIGCFRGYENPVTGYEQSRELFGSRALKLLTLTITEKGYDDKNTALRNFLVDGLETRCELGQPLVVASCDNLTCNGDRTRDLVQGWLDANPRLQSWVSENVSFPNSVVDAITPATTARDLAALEQRLGFQDKAAVFREPFCDWVMERSTIDLDLESVGIRIVDDVQPFEKLKLGILNASHSLLAYFGTLAGYKTVHEAIQDAGIREVVRRFMALVVKQLALPDSVEAAEYCNQTIARFDNPLINHQLEQIAQDGTAKLRERVMPMLTPDDLLCLPIVAWIAFVLSQTRAGRDIVDPSSVKLLERIRADNSPEVVAAHCLEMLAGGRAVASDVTSTVNRMLNELLDDGVETLISRLAR